MPRSLTAWLATNAATHKTAVGEKKIARKILELTKAETRIKLHDIVSRKRSCPLWTALNYFFEEEGDQLVNAFLISNGHSELARNASLQIRKKSKSFRTETHLKKLEIIIFKSFYCPLGKLSQR